MIDHRLPERLVTAQGRQIEADLLGKFEGLIDVFQLHPGRSARFEHAFHHAPAMQIENTRLRKTALQRLAHLTGIDASALGQGQTFRNGGQGHRNDRLIGGFGHLACANIARTSNIGRTLSRASAVQPAMIDSEACSAPT